MVGSSSVEDFLDWLIDYVLVDEDEEPDFGAFAELICRRLVLLGYLKVENNCYVRAEENNYEKTNSGDSTNVLGNQHSWFNSRGQNYN